MAATVEKYEISTNRSADLDETLQDGCRVGTEHRICLTGSIE